jgi:hypothetical protein
MPTSSATRRARSRPGLGLFCLTALLHDPCWGAPPAPPSPATLPCTDPSTRGARDTHVFFADENLERLALRLSSGLYADRQIYDRLVRDIKTIRDRDPELGSVGYRFDHNVRVLRVFFKPLYFWLARTHLYGDWNCLNSFLPADVVTHSDFDYAELTFGGLYNPDIISNAYQSLPGVTMTEFSARIGGGSSIFVTREDAVWHYLFDIAGGDCPSGCTEHEMHYFELAADGRVPKAAIWNSKSHASPPDWATAYFRKYR